MENCKNKILFPDFGGCREIFASMKFKHPTQKLVFCKTLIFSQYESGWPSDRPHCVGVMLPLDGVGETS